MRLRYKDIDGVMGSRGGYPIRKAPSRGFGRLGDWDGGIGRDGDGKFVVGGGDELRAGTQRLAAASAVWPLRGLDTATHGPRMATKRRGGLEAGLLSHSVWFYRLRTARGVEEAKYFNRMWVVDSRRIELRRLFMTW